MGQPDSPRRRRQEWTDEELAYLERVQQDIAGPLNEYQLTVLRRWWNGGYHRSQD